MEASNIDFNPESILPAEYQLQGKLGMGGSGLVFKAFNTMTQQTVALKFFRRTDLVVDSEADAERLRKEGKAISQLDHPNIVKVLNLGFAKDQTPFLIYEFLNGKTLQILLEQKASPKLLASIFGQVSEALQYAHSKGIIHRDVKPGNIMVLASDGSMAECKLIDFGLAKFDPSLLEEKEKRLRDTTTGSSASKLHGSPAYMSPEQCKAAKTDNRSDIYSLACVVFESLVGCPPFDGETSFEVLYKHINTEAPLPNKSLSPGLNALLKKALSKTPENRHSSIREFNEQLQHELQLWQKTRNGSSSAHLIAPIPAIASCAVLTLSILVFLILGRTSTPPDPLKELQKPNSIKIHTTLSNELSDIIDKASGGSLGDKVQDKQQLLQDLAKLIARIRRQPSEKQLLLLFTAYDLKGEINESLYRWDEAIDSYKKTIELAREWSKGSSLPAEALKSYTLIAYCYFKKNDLAHCAEYINSAEEISKQLEEARPSLDSMDLPSHYRQMAGSYLISTLYSLKAKMVESKQENKHENSNSLAYSKKAMEILEHPWLNNRLEKPFVTYACKYANSGNEKEAHKILSNCFSRMKASSNDDKTAYFRFIGVPFSAREAWSSCHDLLSYPELGYRTEILEMMQWLAEHVEAKYRNEYLSKTAALRNSK